MDYSWIVLYLLTAADDMVFFMVIPRNQVCLVHLVGRFSFGMGGPTAAHNCILRLLVDKVGDYLLTISMLPASGLVP